MRGCECHLSFLAFAWGVSLGGLGVRMGLIWNSNCDVTTWSGRDGRGLSLLLKGGEKNKECVSVLYGSFSYYCWRK